MRKLSAVLLFATALASGASMTGFISDSSCGASNGNGSAASRECAKNCINNGAAPVFVSEKDQKVYKLAGKEVKAHLDYKVRITGEVNGDTITVTEIKKAD